ncbi:MAG: response regulator transcription factor [Saprospiraceae bacterium]|uniref:Response regulator transcription factor n=2 Tax=Candidatus Opimibacter skivensis TaxID=2982028 RepID=A0A9D7XQN9_9BACT|nr:response regulator transcription factor [Candidatus Opimibacter skivensis]
MNAINILVVEDEALVAAMIKEALSKTKYSVRAVAFNKASAEKYLATEPIDAALLDINLEGNFEGIEIGRLIRDHHHIPFLYITAHADDQTLHNAKLTQPSGYIVKPFTERDLLAGLEIALYNFHQRQSPLSDLTLINQRLKEPLSNREMDVLKLIFEGRTNQQMSEELFLSINTIKTHLSRLFAKLSVNSRTEAIARVRDSISQI